MYRPRSRSALIVLAPNLKWETPANELACFKLGESQIKLPGKEGSNLPKTSFSSFFKII